VIEASSALISNIQSSMANAPGFLVPGMSPKAEKIDFMCATKIHLRSLFRRRLIKAAKGFARM